MEQHSHSLREIENLLQTLSPDTVIGEFSGRDSVAAILQALKDPGINYILPVISFAGTEYGSIQGLKSNYQRLLKRVESLYGKEKHIYPLVYYSNPKLWSVLNGRLVNSLVHTYNFYTPCIGCHMYFHLLRVPMALKIGKQIVSGERLRHDHRVKLNQLGISLDAYKKVLDELNVTLHFPIKEVEEGDRIKDILGWDWEEGEEHPSCVYSGNYADMKKKTCYKKKNLQHFLDDFLVPVSIELGKILTKNPDASLKELEKPLHAWEKRIKPSK